MLTSKSDWLQSAISLAECGMSWRKIAIALARPKSTVSDALREYYRAAREKEQIHAGAKILLLDIETSPCMAYVWSRWKQNVSQSQVVSEGYILTYSAKWLHSPLIISNRIDDPENDKQIVEELADLINSADIVVAHNGVKFDIKLIKARMVKWGLQPLAPVKLEDTLVIAKQQFRFPSNSLDSLAAYLGLGRKMQHSGFELWVKCMNNDPEAFEEMLEYNTQDVVVLEEVYNKLRAWNSLGANVSLYYNDGEKHCICCGSKKLAMIDKKSYTSLSEFDTYRCSSCGKVMRARSNKRTKEQMQNTLVNVL